MRFAALALVAVTGVSAVSNSDCLSTALSIPVCGQNVLLSIGSASFGCDALDFGCQCLHRGPIQAAATLPVISACNLQTAVEVMSSALAVCDCVSKHAGDLDVTGASSGSSPASATAATTTAALSAGSPSQAATSASAAQTSVKAAAGASSTAPSVSSKFEGAAATAGPFVPVGGLIGVVAGLVAYL